MPEPTHWRASTGNVVAALPNLVTAGRVVIAYATLPLLQAQFGLRVAAVALMLTGMYLDWADGYLARKLRAASDFGAMFDIVGDRIVEHVYWIFFASVGLVSLWVPVIFVSRGLLVDTVRNAACARGGMTPYGKQTMMRSALTRALTGSRASRGMIITGKSVAFALLGFILVCQVDPSPIGEWVQSGTLDSVRTAATIVVWMVVAINLVRGIPVLVDGRAYLFGERSVQEAGEEG